MSIFNPNIFLSSGLGCIFLSPTISLTKQNVANNITYKVTNKIIYYHVWTVTNNITYCIDCFCCKCLHLYAPEYLSSCSTVQTASHSLYSMANTLQLHILLCFACQFTFYTLFSLQFQAAKHLFKMSALNCFHRISGLYMSHKFN